MPKHPFILFLILSVGLFGQDGTRVYEFLNIPTNARQAALGGNTQSATSADPAMSLWNPALMNEKMHGQLGLNYVSYIADISFGGFSTVIADRNNENFFSLNGQYVDYGDFNQTSEIGTITGTFQAKDLAISLGYARNLSDFFTVGGQLKYIDSRIENYQSNGVAVDFGILYHDPDYMTNVGLSVRNLGFQITPYDQVREDLPLQINLSAAHRLKYVPVEFLLTFHDLQQWNISQPLLENGQEPGFGRKLIDHVSVGAELFPGDSFNLRIGYNFKRGNELAVEDVRNFSGLTYGFGLRISSFRFEFAHANYHESTASNHFSLIINLDKILSGRDYYRYRR